MEAKFTQKPYGSNAFEIAAETLKTLDSGIVAERCGVDATGRNLSVSFFGVPFGISMDAGHFEPETMALYEKILVMHYLVSTGNEQTRGDWVPFKALPGGMFYQSAYKKRATDRILQAFGNQPEKIIPAAATLGGARAEYGDVGCKLAVLPRIDAIVALYRGDQEFPPDAAILHRDDIINYLPLEDIAVLGGLIAGRLKKALG